jgi:two-component sensor histidine kinase
MGKSRNNSRTVAASALRITIPYVCLGAAWILFSDRLLLPFTDDPRTMIALSTLKGWFFILITAVLLFFLVYNEISRRDALERELRASLGEKGALLAELNHRVKNNLQIITSILNLEAEDIESLEATELNDRTRGRLRSMGLAYERLFEGGEITRIELGSYLRALWDQLKEVYSAKAAIASFDLSPAWAGAESAVPFGLFAAEAATNALRYGVGSDGIARVDMRLRPAEGDSFELTIRDGGPGPAPGSVGLGFRLMDALAAQLRGRLERWVDGGTVVRLVFPAKDGRDA